MQFERRTKKIESIYYIKSPNREHPVFKNFYLKKYRCQFKNHLLGPFDFKIPRSKSLKEVDINLTNSLCNNGLFYDSLMTITNELRNKWMITNLNFIISEISTITDSEYLEYMILSIRSLKYLKSFTLHATKSFISDGALEMIKKGLKPLRQLKQLYLSPGSRRNTHRDFGIFKQIFIVVPFLQDLRIDFLSWNDHRNNEFRYFPEAIEKLSFLRTLAVSFKKSVAFQDAEMSLLITKLQNLKSLRDLRLDLGGCTRINGMGMLTMESLFQDLRNLTGLNICLNSCDMIKEDKFKAFLTSCSKLFLVETLSLNFQLCRQITDELIEEMKISFLQLKKIKTLTLDLTSCNQITDKSLDHLRQGVERLNLHKLTLILGFCIKFTNGGLTSFLEVLTKFPSLKFLNLNLGNYIPFNNEGILHLSQKFEYLKNLEGLCLYFRQCDEIGDNGIDHLLSGMHHLHQLRKFTLDIGLCKFLTHKSLDAIVRYAQRLPSTLELFELSIDQIKSITVSLINNLAILLADIKPTVEFKINDFV